MEKNRSHYSQLIERLYSINLHGAEKIGLENMQRMQKILAFPDRSFETIHVAGTNGKGSVATKIAAALQLGGKKVGLFTSPHISCFRERIKIDGQMVSEALVAQTLDFLFSLIEKEQIAMTFFEITTWLGILIFTHQKVDIAVLETGIGGRLDATNIISPILSIITSVSLDHTEILGDTVEAIAREKAGIIKAGIPLVIGPQVPRNLMQEITIDLKSPLIAVEGDYSCFEEENRAIAKAALESLPSRYNLGQKEISLGLEETPPCRCEWIQRECPIVMDVGHNPAGLQQLLKAVRMKYPTAPLNILFGLSKSKDIEGCLEVIGSQGSQFYPVEAVQTNRGVSAVVLMQKLKDFGIAKSCIHLEDKIEKSLLKAIKETEIQKGILVLCGTFFIMASLRKILGFVERGED